MNIAIIGCGYVGTALAMHWRAAGHCVTASTRKPERLPELEKIADNVFILTPDLPQSLLQLLIDQDAVLFAMAPDQLDQYESTYLHIAQAFQQVLPQLPRLKQVIYTSSTSVYGDHQGGWVDETTPVNSFEPRRHILIETEKVLQIATQSNRLVCILRLGEIFGPDRELSARLKKGKPLAGNGDAFTNLIHLDDIVKGIDFSLQHSLNGIYNLCNDLHILRRELYNILCAREGLPTIIWDPSLPNSHGGNRRVSNDKLKAVGFHFIKSYSLD